MPSTTITDESADAATPDMFRWDGEPDDNPQLTRDRFWLWCQQTEEKRIPFPLLPWPTGEQAEALLEAVGWTRMRAQRMFHVHGHVMSAWLSATSRPTSGRGDYSVVGAQAGWSALAWATGLPPAPTDDTSGGADQEDEEEL